MAERKSGKTLTPQPAGQPSTAPHQRNAGPHRMDRWLTSNGIQDPATRQDGNEMMLLDVLFTLFLTHVGHIANVRKQPASLRSDSGPHHRNQWPTSQEYAGLPRCIYPRSKPAMTACVRSLASKRVRMTLICPFTVDSRMPSSRAISLFDLPFARS